MEFGEQNLERDFSLLRIDHCECEKKFRDSVKSLFSEFFNINNIVFEAKCHYLFKVFHLTYFNCGHSSDQATYCSTCRDLFVNAFCMEFNLLRNWPTTFKIYDIHSLILMGNMRRCYLFHQNGY